MLLIKQLVPLSPYHQSKQQSMGFVGIGKIRLQTRWENPQILLQAIQKVQEKQHNVFIQIFDSVSIISPKHLYYSMYFAEQAFSLSSNISKTKSMEYLIYASVQRQIKNAIESVGFSFDDNGKHPDVANVVISAKNKHDIEVIASDLTNSLNAQLIEDSYPPFTPQRIKFIQETYLIGDFELTNAILSLGHPTGTKITDLPKETKSRVFLHVMVEKMAHLFMENFKHAT